MPYTPSGPLFSLHVKIQIAPENTEKFFSYFKPVYEAVCAEKECVFFEVYHNEEQPGVFKWVENWNAGVEWMVNVQLKKEYYKKYFEMTEPMFIKPREHEVWQRSEGTKWFYVEKEFYWPSE